LFLVNELDSSLYRFDIDRDRGTLTERQRLSTLPADYHGRRWSADVHVAPSGRFVYVSNRAHDSIAVCSIGPDGTMAVVGHQSTLGRTPRNFTLDSRGTLLFAVNQDSDTVVVFTVDERTGRLQALHAVPVSPRPYVVCVC
jgi:6-phosphogluconolactonase